MPENEEVTRIFSLMREEQENRKDCIMRSFIIKSAFFNRVTYQGE
jgi:hypothetical protein